MNLRSLSHLSNQELLRSLAAIVARDRGTTAEMLAHIAEVDDRRLYAQEGFPSMFAYCVQVLHMSEDTAFKRIRAARTARQFPAIFEAVADGRLHLSAVVVLAPYLTEENATELLAEMPGAELHLRNRLGQLSEEVLKDYVTISDPMAQRVADAASLSTKWNL